MRKCGAGGSSDGLNVSLCQSGMFLQRQARVTLGAPNPDVRLSEVRASPMGLRTVYGELRRLTPSIEFSESQATWVRLRAALGGNSAVWRERAS